MTMPSFMVIGAAKCGTTSLCDLVGQHPDVFMSDPKEPDYFSRLTRLEETRGRYESLFEDAGSCAAVGEGSTSYTHPNRVEIVAPRIAEAVPDCSLIYMVRHPVRRLESDWKMRRRERRVPSSINEAVEIHASLITFGFYWKHLGEYRRLFDDDQILIVFLEDFADDPLAELGRVFEHVGVDPGFVPEDPDERRNAAEKMRRDGALASTARKLPGFRMLKKSLPRPAVESVKRLVTEEYEAEVDWDPGVLEEVRGYFRPDARRLLEHCGKPHDFWGL